MNSLKIGFARVNTNPPLGIFVSGYYIPRHAKGFLDDLESTALALECGDTKLLMISVDISGINKDIGAEFKEAISQATGIPVENMILSATHTHTGPKLFVAGTPSEHDTPELYAEYRNFLKKRLVDVCRLALQDVKPCRMAFGHGWAPERVAYIRRYRMKDGSTFTCPPINDPNIVGPIGELDQRVHVLRFDQEGGYSIILVNYGLHADTINGELISADWPGVMRRTLERTLDNVKCVSFIGAEGDVGSTHVNPTGGDMNDTEISFDNEMKSPGMCRFVGRALAGTVLQVYDKLEYIDVDQLRLVQNIIRVPSNMPKPEELPLAHLYKELHDSGRDCDIPYTGMQLTTAVATATRMCNLENGPEYYELPMTAVSIGDVAIVTLPGEPFTDIGVGIKDTEGWRSIMPFALSNGSQGYFPMQSAFDEGGYEAGTSKYAPGVAEALIANGKQLLSQLKEK